MFNFKTILFTSASIFLLTGCLAKLNTQSDMKMIPKNTEYLIETKDVNDIKELEVSNNLIQFLPVISITGVQVLFDENTKDEKPMFFRNEKCIFQGLASADLTTKRVKVKLDKATCRVGNNHKVNYKINGWVLGEDESFGLKASKEIINKIDEDHNEDLPLPKEITVLSVKQGEYAYVSIDMVKQIETLTIKDTPKVKMKKDIPSTPIQKESTRLIKMQ